MEGLGVEGIGVEGVGVEFGRSDAIRVGTGEVAGRVVEVSVTWDESSTARERNGTLFIIGALFLLHDLYKIHAQYVLT